jgi:hypothetical protein
MLDKKLLPKLKISQHLEVPPADKENTKTCSVRDQAPILLSDDGSVVRINSTFFTRSKDGVFTLCSGSFQDFPSHVEEITSREDVIVFASHVRVPYHQIIAKKYVCASQATMRRG